MKRTYVPFLLLAILAAVIPLPAQTVTPRSIVFTGASQSQAELLTLSGLTPGKLLTKDDVEAATHRLDDSGLFLGVQYSFTAGILTFALEPATRNEMQRVHYVNFVWFTQQQLTEAVHARLPLFTGSVPANGELKQQVASALEAIIRERGVKASVTAQGVSGGRLDYSIVSPPVIVGELKIENIRFESDPMLASVRSALVGAEYLDGITAQAVHGNLSNALEELGYLDETVSPVNHAEPVVEPTRITVPMVGTAQPGPRYKVARVDLPAPSGTITAAELESEHQVKSGGLPSPSLVQNTVARLAFIYAGHGFLDAHASVDASRDHATHTMSYSFHVIPGEVYHVRGLTFAPTVNSSQQAQLEDAWKLPKGAVYNRAAADQSLLSSSVKSMCGGPVVQQLLPDRATHEVEIRLSCGHAH